MEVNKDLMRLIAGSQPVPPKKSETATFEFEDTDLFSVIREMSTLEERIKMRGLVVPRSIQAEVLQIEARTLTSIDADYGDRILIEVSLTLEKTPERFANDQKMYEEELIKWRRSMENSKKERAALFQQEVAALAKKYGLEPASEMTK